MRNIALLCYTHSPARRSQAFPVSVRGYVYIHVHLLLTLGAHARGLRYLVCVCVCVRVSVCLSVRHHESCHYAQRSVQPKVPTASAQAGKHFKYGVFSKNALFKSYGVTKLTSLVCAYRDIIWRRWSDISPEISKTRPFLVLSKSNGRLQATWQSKAASY